MRGRRCPPSPYLAPRLHYAHGGSAGRRQRRRSLGRELSRRLQPPPSRRRHRALGREGIQDAADLGPGLLKINPGLGRTLLQVLLDQALEASALGNRFLLGLPRVGRLQIGEGPDALQEPLAFLHRRRGEDALPRACLGGRRRFYRGRDFWRRRCRDRLTAADLARGWRGQRAGGARGWRNGGLPLVRNPDRPREALVGLICNRPPDQAPRGPDLSLRLARVRLDRGHVVGVALRGRRLRRDVVRLVQVALEGDFPVLPARPGAGQVAGERERAGAFRGAVCRRRRLYWGKLSLYLGLARPERIEGVDGDRWFCRRGQGRDWRGDKYPRTSILLHYLRDKVLVTTLGINPVLS